MNNRIKNSLFVLGIMFSFVIGIWIENDSKGVYAVIEPIVNFKIPLILALLTTAVLYLYHNHKVTELEAKNTNLEQQVKDGSRALWKYFKDIGEVKVREITEDVMSHFTTKHRHVLAVQIYEYSVKHYKAYTLFTVLHKYHHVSESTDINALLKSYYKIPKDLYDEYIDARMQLNQGILLEHNITVANEFCKKHIEAIEKKETHQLTEEDAITYALVQVVLETLSYLLNQDFSHTFPEETARHLDSLKRTGILKGIEIKNLFTFEYKGISEKLGRTYLTETIDDPELFNGRPHIILITLNPDYLPEGDQEQLQERWDLGEEFREELQKELKIRYNELKETVQ